MDGAPVDPAFIDQIFNRKMAAPDSIKRKLKDSLETHFRDLRLPAVNACALANLLCPSRHVVSLKEAAIPSDLYLTGHLTQPIEVTPAETTVTPGKTVQFTAKIVRGGGGVHWSKPSVGSIDANGLYTAPKSIGDAKVVVLTAISKDDANLTGSAMVMVYEPPAKSGVAIAPATAIVTARHSIELSTVDARDTAVTVTWVLSPDVGKISKGWQTGQYKYTAPETVAAITEIKATAANAAHPTERGESRIRLLPQVTISVSPAEASIKPGGSVDLRAAVAGVGDPQVRWAVFPASGGTVTTHDDRSRATFQAPRSGAVDDVKVVAYLLDGAAGIGSASITVG